MNRNVVLAACCLLAGATSQSAHVEPTYECTVQRIYQLGENGELRLSNYSAKAAGDRFVVSKTTGQIIGPWLSTAKATSTEVLREGDDAGGWSFQAVARFDVGANHSAQVLEIRGWESGPRKPFVAAAFGGAGIITGTCEAPS